MFYRWIPLFLICYAGSAWALVQVKTIVETDSERISPTVILAENAWAEVNTDTLTLRLRVTSRPDASALVEAELFRIEEGVSKLIAKPSIIAKWNQSAVVSSTDDDGNLLYRLTLTPSENP